MTPRDGSPAGGPSSRAVDTDERPFVLVWEVTQACELACDHCRADARPHRHTRELSTAEGKRLLDEARRFGEGQIVVLSGGDPMVRDDIIELVEYGTEHGLRMTLTPSGTERLGADDVADLADAGLRRLALSVDGPETVHDLFRGEVGSFERTVEAAEAARSVGLPLQVNTTVCQTTAGSLPEVRDLVATSAGIGLLVVAPAVGGTVGTGVTGLPDVAAAGLALAGLGAVLFVANAASVLARHGPSVPSLLAALRPG